MVPFSVLKLLSDVRFDPVELNFQPADPGLPPVLYFDFSFLEAVTAKEGETNFLLNAGLAVEAALRAYAQAELAVSKREAEAEAIAEAVDDNAS